MPFTGRARKLPDSFIVFSWVPAHLHRDITARQLGFAYCDCVVSVVVIYCCWFYLLSFILHSKQLQGRSSPLSGKAGGFENCAAQRAMQITDNSNNNITTTTTTTTVTQPEARCVHAAAAPRAVCVVDW